ncbi:MAG: hypothetical protein KDH20_09780 [Rhodocyclaceae bacterium]|nr:hypothetical protein [Rhodocyclaceae bacterium]
MSKLMRRTTHPLLALFTALLLGACGSEPDEPRPYAGGPEGGETVRSAGQPDGARALRTAATADRPAGGVVMREHPLRDPGMNNIVASVVLVPEGWQLEGGLSRPSNQLYNMPVLADVKITAPDGRAVHFFPSLSFEFNHASPGQALQPTLGGNLYLALPESPGRWFLQMAQMSPDPTVSNLQLVSEEPVPELTQQLRQQSAQLFQIVEQGNATTASMGFGQSFDTQATKLVLSYQQDGKAFEETVLIAWQYMVLVQQGQVASGHWSVPLMRSFRGAPGSDYMNDPVLKAIVQSIRANPAWEAEMQRYWRELARIKQKGASDRSASWQQHNRKMQQINGEISDIIAGGYQRRSAIQDGMHSRSVDALRDETPYTTPSGETVKLPSFYDHVYTDGNGTYILNNDSLYNPNTDPSVNSRDWNRIEAQR